MLPWIACRIISSAEAVGAFCHFGRTFGRNGGRFSARTMQAIVEGDRDIYAAFAKLPDASSRNFTTWQPDSVRMKIRSNL
jgi:hypothetical protein